MRIAFAGTPEFARVALEALYKAGHEIALVLTQPDKPAGRGLHMQPSPVKQFALAQGFTTIQPRGLKLDGKFAEDAQAAHDAISIANPEVIIVAAYGLILPSWMLQLPKHGCLNIHASLLPRWRGAAPIHRAIEAGDTETGITIMQMDAGLDTGDILLRHAVPIASNATTGALHDVLAEIGGHLICETLTKLSALKPEKQAQTGVTYARKIEKSEALINWQLSAQALSRQVGAFNPYPISSCRFNGSILKIWSAQVLPQPAPDKTLPGQVISVSHQSIDVACGTGVLQILELQRAGGKRMSLQNFLNGFTISVGDGFDLDSTIHPT